MKKLLIAALIACTSAASMAADTAGSYVAASVGQSEYKFGGDKEHHTGVGIAFGQSLADNVGYEVGYSYLGKFDAGGAGHAFYLAGVGKYPLAQGFDVHGKIGPTVNHFSGSDGIDSETRVRLLLGAGIGYELDKNWVATLDYTHFGKALGLTSSMWSVGVQYHY